MAISYEIVLIPAFLILARYQVSVPLKIWIHWIWSSIINLQCLGIFFANSPCFKGSFINSWCVRQQIRRQRPMVKGCYHNFFEKEERRKSPLLMEQQTVYRTNEANYLLPQLFMLGKQELLNRSHLSCTDGCIGEHIPDPTKAEL